MFSFIPQNIFVLPFIYCEPSSSMMNILPKTQRSNILITAQTHLEINISNTTPMPSIVKTPNHHYNAIAHNLQETNHKKTKQTIHKNTSSFHHQLLHNCHLPLLTIDSTITSIQGFINPNSGSHQVSFFPPKKKIPIPKIQPQFQFHSY